MARRRTGGVRLPAAHPVSPASRSSVAAVDAGVGAGLPGRTGEAACPSASRYIPRGWKVIGRNLRSPPRPGLRAGPRFLRI